MRKYKKLVSVLSAVAVAVLISSLLFNRPFRLKKRWYVAPKSVEVAFPTSEVPDNIVLTPSEDSKTMMTVTWRTSASVTDGAVRYAPVDAEEGRREDEKKASHITLFSPELTEDNNAHCHSAVLSDLLPGTAYRYRVGSPDTDVWSEYSAFTTAPSTPESFTFGFFGDIQRTPSMFGSMVKMLDEKYPEMAFTIIGGDLVDAGDLRNFWDRVMAASGTLFSRKPLAPVMGNHDFGNTNTGSKIFMTYYRLPGERKESRYPPNYRFEYGNAVFLMVNSLDVQGQTKWLEQELRNADAQGYAFKVVVFHVPVYRTKKNTKDNTAAQQQWAPLFDKYGVDLVLTGHDHSYMRSKPVKAGQAVEEGEQGVVYIMATSCRRFYEFETLDIAEKQLGETATWQVITFGFEQGEGRRIQYKAYDANGRLVDEFERGKPIPAGATAQTLSGNTKR